MGPAGSLSLRAEKAKRPSFPAPLLKVQEGKLDHRRRTGCGGRPQLYTALIFGRLSISTGQVRTFVSPLFAPGNRWCCEPDAPPRGLPAQVAALEADGLSAYLWVGCYRMPSPTLTGSLVRDMALVHQVRTADARGTAAHLAKHLDGQLPQKSCQRTVIRTHHFSICAKSAGNSPAST